MHLVQLCSPKYCLTYCAWSKEKRREKLMFRLIHYIFPKWKSIVFPLCLVEKGRSNERQFNFRGTKIGRAVLLGHIPWFCAVRSCNVQSWDFFCSFFTGRQEPAWKSEEITLGRFEYKAPNMLAIPSLVKHDVQWPMYYAVSKDAVHPGERGQIARL